MAPRIYTSVVTIGGISLYQVTGDPNGTLSAARGSVAFDDASPPQIWQNTDGVTAWSKQAAGASLFSVSINTVLAAGSNNIVLVDASGGPVDITLPPAGSSSGEYTIVKKIDTSANLVTVKVAGADTVEGAATDVLGSGSFREGVRYDNDGTSAWWASADHVSGGGGGGGGTAPLVFGAGSIAASTTSRYLYPGYDDDLAHTSPIVIEMTQAGTLRNLRLVHNTPGGNGNDVVYTVRVNGVATAITVTLASTAATAADVANSVAFVAGDKVDIEVTKALGIAGGLSNISATLEAA